MKRKSLRSALALVSVTALMITGCGNNQIGNQTVDTTQPADTAQTTEAPAAPAADTAAATETPAEPAETEMPTDTVEANELTYSPDTTLRMAVGYNNKENGLTFDAEKVGESITLADGKTYKPGEFKPTWVEVMNRLQFKIEDKFTGAGSDAKEFDYWKERLNEVDMVSGTAAQLQENGAEGKIVNIGEYLDMMPNFKAYLDANQIVRLSITGDVSNGAIYFSPYFDGVDDIEKMPLMRVDWIQKLLDGDGEFAAAKSDKTKAPVYQPYMPTSGKVEVDVVAKDGSKVEKVTKDYDTAGNIIDKMNAAGSIDGVAAVNMLRTYIDEAYGGYYGTTRSDLFCGQNAAWDADELVALLRCVCANSATLNADGQQVQGIFSREEAKMPRRADMYRLAAQLFGVRGVEGRQEFLYIGNDGQVHDARQEKELYDAMERMNALTQEGLISQGFIDKNEDMKTKAYLEKDLGFMHYDYNQTQTIYNEQDGIFDAGEKYEAVMIPVARWNDGTGEAYFRFTDSWRSVKTGGWGISKEGVGDDQDKLYACLKLIDYAYSREGTILMSYGPDAFIKTDASGNYVNFDFNGQEWPEIADATRAELWEKANGNYTNYARIYLGSTLSFMKSQAFEYQCTTEVGREGAGYLSKAIALGTIKHPVLAIPDNMWYTSVPTTFPYTKSDNDAIKGMTDLTGKFSTRDDGENVLIDIIMNGFVAEGLTSPDACVATVTDGYNGKAYLQIANTSWAELQDYYKSLQ